MCHCQSVSAIQKARRIRTLGGRGLGRTGPDTEAQHGETEPQDASTVYHAPLPGRLHRRHEVVLDRHMCIIMMAFERCQGEPHQEWLMNRAFRPLPLPLGEGRGEGQGIGSDR